ncbi:MAG: hypothetical protein PHQ00_03100, partial [Phycisphaerae bacterium]|nr:hypothetical protein [Phycisphaerae bacterium]
WTNQKIINKALGKIGGAGNQLGAEPFISDITAQDPITVFAVNTLEVVIRKAIEDLALRDCPFRESLKYADLGTELHAQDVGIASIAIGVDPFPITITTATDHNRITGDIVYLTEILGTGGIEDLNNAAYTITVTGDKTFTLDGTAGEGYVHTASSGIVAYTPEVGGWAYAFALPSDYIAMVAQLQESFNSTTKGRQKYRFETIINRTETGMILLTNDLSNTAGTSAFVQYVIYQDNPAVYSNPLVECVATLLAAELCPMVGKGMDERIKLLQEYQQVNIPEAMKFNTSQYNNLSKFVPNFLGGRGEANQEDGSNQRANSNA